MTQTADDLAEETELDAERDPRPTNFAARYGAILVGRGIATFPTLLLRFQSDLRIGDFDLTTLMWIFSFYRSPQKWPSVSIEKMTKARGCPRYQIEQSVKRLERLGYIVRAGIDRRFGTYRFDATPLLKRLEDCAGIEIREAALEAAMKREKARLRARVAPNPEEASEQIENLHRELDIEDLNRERTKRTAIELGVSESEPVLRMH